MASLGINILVAGGPERWAVILGTIKMSNRYAIFIERF